LGCFENEISRAEKIYQQTGETVVYFMNKVALGSGIDGKLAKESISACVNSVLHSPDAFLWLMQLKNRDEYTAQHSLNVCILSIVLGRYIGMSELQLNHIGLCGMMHDMGKMLVPLEILNKPGKLTKEEMTVMQSHTTLGYELLKSSDNMFFGAVETALTHHERMDGKGYPRSMGSSRLSFNSNIIAIADIYDAITSDRVYQKGRTHHQATKIMLDVSGSHLDAKLVVKFIESLGVYPPGCFVELSNGAIAVVLEVSGYYQLRPKVLLILNEDKQEIAETVVDLANTLMDAAGLPLSISAIIQPAEYNIDSEKYYRQGVIQKGFSQKR
jgi:HD-GYP domain-containing protein (c-di-GMP phosphodiesterase class II)